MSLVFSCQTRSSIIIPVSRLLIFLIENIPYKVFVAFILKVKGKFANAKLRRIKKQDEYFKRKESRKKRKKANS
ncbi:UNVERIFIED_CONTAM: hypothetical protein NCL1_30248 [Trichonephila clavipes]